MKQRIYPMLGFKRFGNAAVTISGAGGWRGLVPLRSTRADVERLLGQPREQCRCVYETPSEIVYVDYSRGRCKGELSGWNVPADTVLRLSVSPKQRPRLEDLKINPSEYVVTRDDDWTTHYGSRARGVRYTVSSSGAVVGISYVPSSGDRRLRCLGFPAEDTSIVRYTPHDLFSARAGEDWAAHLDLFAGELLDRPTVRGYVMVYAGRRSCRGEATAQAERARDYLVKTRGVDASRVLSLDGGYRDEFTTELYVVPLDAPPPVASPHLRANEVTVKDCSRTGVSNKRR